MEEDYGPLSPGIDAMHASQRRCLASQLLTCIARQCCSACPGTVPISRTIAAVGPSQQQKILHFPVAWRIAAVGLPAQPNVLQPTRRPENHQPNSLLQVPLVTQWQQQQRSRSPSHAIATAMIHAQTAAAYQGLRAAALGGLVTGPQDGVEQAQRKILKAAALDMLTAACEAHTVSPSTGGKHDASAASSRGARHQTMDEQLQLKLAAERAKKEVSTDCGLWTAGEVACIRMAYEKASELETLKRERDMAFREKDEVHRGKDAEISRLRALATSEAVDAVSLLFEAYKKEHKSSTLTLPQFRQVRAPCPGGGLPLCSSHALPM